MSTEGNASILVVDDDPTNILLLTRILTKSGYKVEKAQSGAECLEWVGRHSPDLILLDIRMPGMDGFEVCRRLKADAATARIPVMFLTAEGRSDENVSVGFGVGACDYITKPFSRIDVLARVQVVLRQQALQENYRQLAGQDPLTGLCNRRRAYERMVEVLSLATRHGEAVSVIMIDLDQFKSVNDSHGHAFGDEIIVRFARLLQTECRLEDVICRHGGDEFLLVLPNTSAEKATRLAERLGEIWAGKAVRAPDGRELHLTASFGIACSRLDEDTTDGQEIIQRADKAVYAAKKLGRNRVVRFDQIESDSHSPDCASPADQASGHAS